MSIKLRLNSFTPFVFPVYWLTLVLLYAQGHSGILVDDGQAGLVDFMRQGWKGFPNSYNAASLYYFHDLVNNLAFLAFGTNTFSWFLMMSALHACNAWLMFKNMKRFYTLCAINHPSLIALTGSVLFLLSPYQSENILWAATHHYSFLMLFFQIQFFLLLTLNIENTKRNTLGMALLFCVSLVTLEQALVFPGVFLVLFFVLKRSASFPFSTRKYVLNVLSPQAFSIAVYFILTKLIKGHWLPHYGTRHLEHIHGSVLSATFLKYIVKYIGFVHTLAYPLREKIYNYIDDNTTLVALLLVGIVVGLRLLLKNRKTLFITLSLLLCTLLLLLPVLNQFFMVMSPFENSRLGYFGSVMLYQVFALTLFSISVYLGYLVAFCYLLFSIHEIRNTTQHWQNAGTFFERCVTTLPEHKKGRIFLLSIPLKYQDIYAFRSAERITYAYQLVHKREYTDRLIPVAWTNFYSPSDSILVEQTDSNTLNVSIKTKGTSWWMQEGGLGATPVENENFTFHVDQWGLGYTLTLKHLNQEDCFYYISNNQFKAFTLH